MRGGALPEIFGRVLEDQLAAALDVDDPFLNEACRYLLRAGGKRLRPALVFLCAQAGPAGAAGVEQAMPLAVACEILHTATLIHDDLVDGSAIRRGLPTLSARWGDKVAILCGDYLFSRALTMVSQLGRSDVSVRLGEVMQHTCEAEISQVIRAYDPTATEQQYLENIKRKSALLIAECCRSGALLAGAAPQVAGSLYEYGEHVGIAFQIADDILDLTAPSEAVGKPTGRDIGLGLLTLPVIKALEENDELRVLMRRRLSRQGDLEQALAIVRRSGGVEYARLRAEEHVAAAVRAVEVLPPEEPRPSLEAVARFAIQRDR
jgi:geranylgeranyl pyrophosphate synthase